MYRIELVPSVSHVLSNESRRLKPSRRAIYGPSAFRRPGGDSIARDRTDAYFAGSDRDRASFEAGIKLGSIYHQFLGAPLTRATAGELERAIEAGVRVQPCVEDVRVRIDRKRLKGRGPYKYASLTEDMITAEVTIRVGKSRALGVLRYVPELDYPLMYLKSVAGPLTKT